MPKTITEKLNSGREYRNFTFDLEPIDPESKKDDDFIVRGYATTFNDPYLLFSDDGYELFEQIDANAFNECDMSDTIFQYNHEGRVYARISNNTLSIVPDLKGLNIKCDLSGTAGGRELYEEIKGGYITKMSIGMVVGEDNYKSLPSSEGYKEIRTITRIKKLYDVSAVSIPANDATSISARSLGEKTLAEFKRRMTEKRQLEIEKLKLKLRINM